MQDANTRDNIRPIFSSDIGKETREKRKTTPFHIFPLWMINKYRFSIFKWLPYWSDSRVAQKYSEVTLESLFQMLFFQDLVLLYVIYIYIYIYMKMYFYMWIKIVRLILNGSIGLQWKYVCTIPSGSRMMWYTTKHVYIFIRSLLVFALFAD